jgi:hypothetical protein
MCPPWTLVQEMAKKGNGGMTYEEFPIRTPVPPYLRIYSYATTLIRPIVAPLSSVVQVSLTEIIFFTFFSFANWLIVLSSLSNSPFALNIFIGHVNVLTFIMTWPPSSRVSICYLSRLLGVLNNPVSKFLKQFPSTIKDYPSRLPVIFPSHGRVRETNKSLDQPEEQIYL